MSSTTIIDKLLRFYFSKQRNRKTTHSLNDIGRILIIRQHNQFGDLLASIALFRAIKEAYPHSSISVIVSPENYYALSKNQFVDRLFIFDKGKIINPDYVFNFSKYLKYNYDLCIVPVTVSISKTSCILAGLSDAKLKIGPAELEGKENNYSYIFNKTVNMNWSDMPERNVADFGQDILKPLGIRTDNLKSEISYDKSDLEVADKFLNLYDGIGDGQLIIGLHVGAGKIPNRWGSEQFAELINDISEKWNASFYLTGTDSDKQSVTEVLEKIDISPKLFMNKTVPEVAALISKSNLFITNDTGIMHVAGAVDTPQISIFGPTNPNNWAPVGGNKYWLKKGNYIDSVSVKDVLELAERILG